MPNFIITLKHHAVRIFFSLIILTFFVLHANGIFRLDSVDSLERKAYDVRLEITMPNRQDPQVVIMDIDEKSLNEIGRWPWNRAVIAQIFDRLFNQYHISVLGIDVVFAEPDDSSGLKKLQNLAAGPLKNSKEFLTTLNTLQTELDYDALLANSMENRRIVLGYIFTNAEQETQDVETGKLPQPSLSAEETKAYQLSYIEANGFVANLPRFQVNAAAAGHFNSATDEDGIVRRVPMLYGYKGELYESLSLAVTRLAIGVPSIEPIIQQQGNYSSLEALKVGNYRIPVDQYAQAFVPYRGKRGSFPYISAADVWQGRVADPERLKGKIVLMGTTAQGLLDLRATPVESVYPGVEVHANLISGILNGTIMANPDYVRGIEMSLLILTGIIMITILPIFSPLASTIGTGVILGLVVWINLLVWTKLHLVLPIATTLLLILTLFLFYMSYGYFVESRGKRQLTGLFGQYVPPELVDEMSKNPGAKFSMEGQSREMTVLFSDVRGFTTISEGLEPRELSELMNEFLTPMTHIIHEHRGTIDKYMGDAIMAFWGAPLQDAEHARHALQAGMQMIARLQELQPQFRAHGWPEIKIGVGLNSGIMSVGNMGSEFRIAYTVLGDAVNLGSRLEGLTKQYGVQLIVSETTCASVPDYLFRELDRVRVKGKDQPVAIFEPIGMREQVSVETCAELADYQQALQHYRQQDWQQARAQFADLQKRFPDRLLYEIYAERVAYFIETPPGIDWDGVYTFTTK